MRVVVEEISSLFCTAWGGKPARWEATWDSMRQPGKELDNCCPPKAMGLHAWRCAATCIQTGQTDCELCGSQQIAMGLAGVTTRQRKQPQSLTK